MGVLKLAERYSSARLKSAIKKALSFTASPSYKSNKNIFPPDPDQADQTSTKRTDPSAQNPHAITWGTDYYRR